MPMRDVKSNNVGVITTAETKENGVLLMQSILSNGIIFRAKEVFSVGTTAWRQTDDGTEAERFEEMSALKVELELD